MMMAVKRDAVVVVAADERELEGLLDEGIDEEKGEADVHASSSESASGKEKSWPERCRGFTKSDGKEEEEEEDVDGAATRRRLVIAIVVAGVFLLLEAIGGIVANSLAVLTDAAHILSDVGGFVLSLLAIYMSRKKPTSVYSYGFRRCETIAALMSMLLIWGCTAALVTEAVQRLRCVWRGLARHTNVRACACSIAACYC